ncbi:RND superfamily putative drug exporter [Haloactinopolyspora alba]|uniref:RND superfamily putative drug exporter n=1 Tax=Haloactinopolyspora alba TaxID=648780 RepID=A0A2P8DY33_9ACTN|nr:MMPL family transporter [Haloactinopolyspora alba]PSL02139.1 RND superfamily putative drug exporter [Haloactinopolyspora alba]
MSRKQQRQPATVRVARWSAIRPWRAIGAWFAFLVVCVGGMSVAGIQQASDVDLGVGEAGRATEMIAEADLQAPATENVLITGASAGSGGFDAALADEIAGDVTRRMQALPDVAEVREPVEAADGEALMVPVVVAGDPDTAEERVDALLGVTERVDEQYPAMLVEQAGSASIMKSFNGMLEEDLGTIAMLSVPVTLAVLLLAFGAILAAGVPVLLGVSSVASAIGLYALASHAVPDGGTVTHLVLLVGMAVGVDYSLFYLRREREERARGRGTIEAVEIAAATSGHSVVVSGTAVAVSMAGLYLAGDVNFASMATGAILVVVVAVVGSLTVLPAMLAKLGRLVDRPRLPLVWRLTASSRRPRFWPAVLRPALRRPAVTFGVSVAALLALAAPALNMSLSNPSEESFPRSLPVMQSYDRLVDTFPSSGTSHVVAVEHGAGERAAVDDALDRLGGLVAVDGHFAHDQPPRIRTADDGTVTTATLGVPYPPQSDEAAESLRVLRDEVLPAAFDDVGAEIAVGGGVAENVDYSDNLSSKLPWIIGFVLVLAFVMMTVTFRSVVVGATTVFVNLLSTVAAFGVLTLVFQNTWAEGVLDFTSNGAVVVWIPLFLFVILFGLSMDYHVFVVSRIREAVDRGVSTREAIREGITGSAGVVTSAALVMVAVFGLFAAMRVVEMKQMGVGLAVAILIDAVVIRAVVLPSLMALLGRANWWAPRFMRRRAPVAQDARELDPVG